MSKPTAEKPAPSSPLALSGKQKRHLRALGHHLQPVVLLGREGVTEGVVAAVDAALTQHELVKVKLGSETPDDRHDVAALLSEQTRASLAQVLGGTMLLYRRHPKTPKIELPRA